MNATDNLGVEYKPIITKKEKVIKVVMPQKNVPNGTEYIEFSDDCFCAEAETPGYYVITDINKAGSRLVRFNDKADDEYILKQTLMPVTGVKKRGYTAVVMATGMNNSFYVRVGVKSGRYSLALRYVLGGNEPYEDISFEIHMLSDKDDYNDMARIYRNHQLQSGVCVPLKERIKNNPALAYAAESIEVRIRMGWKPVPSPVLQQTIETEPPMHIACTFNRVKDIVDELRRQGVDKAEICLVGWNVSGHDGRWPQSFPVEEKLGGEEKLCSLISYAKQNGYQIVCHTNSTDCYSIADYFSEDIIAKKRDGSLSENYPWGGGMMYDMCPVKSYDIAQIELPKVAKLGFSGLHYIDVISSTPLRRCYDKNHPANEHDTAMMYKQIGELTQKLFGGFASEGGYDFAASYLDYAMYVDSAKDPGSFFDDPIPFWQLVYHGIILSNPSTSTVNYTLKDSKCRAKFLSYGGRPLFYYYSHFMNGSGNDDWLGKTDLICDTDEQLRQSVTKIKEAYDEFKSMRHLQLEFMEKYLVNDEGAVTEYSDGTRTVIR